MLFSRHVTANLLASFGLYGGAFAISFIAGLFPLISIEVFLVGLSALRPPTIPQLALIVALSAIAHQLAKTITYYAGERALEMPHGKTRARIERARKYVDRWNKRPKLILLVGATVGLPPMYLLGFIAKPLMHLGFKTFTAITLFGRLGRYATLAAIPLLF